MSRGQAFHQGSLGSFSSSRLCFQGLVAYELLPLCCGPLSLDRTKKTAWSRSIDISLRQSTEGQRSAIATWRLWLIKFCHLSQKMANTATIVVKLAYFVQLKHHSSRRRQHFYSCHVFFFFFYVFSFWPFCVQNPQNSAMFARGKHGNGGPCRWVTNLAAAGAAIMSEEHAIEEACHVAAVEAAKGGGSSKKGSWNQKAKQWAEDIWGYLKKGKKQRKSCMIVLECFGCVVLMVFIFFNGFGLFLEYRPVLFLMKWNLHMFMLLKRHVWNLTFKAILHGVDWVDSGSSHKSHKL